jgi:hypothetical protein
VDVIYFREQCPCDKLVATAFSLFSMYIGDDASKQVNLPAHIVKNLKGVQAGLLGRRGAAPVSRDLFNEAFEELKTIPWILTSNVCFCIKAPLASTQAPPEPPRAAKAPAPAHSPVFLTKKKHPGARYRPVKYGTKRI